MTEAERIENDAKIYVNSIPRIRKRMNLFSGYIAGATAENLRLQQELRDAVIGQEQLALDLVRALDLNKSLEDQIEYQNKSAKEDHDKISKLEFELKSAQELNREMMEKFQELLDSEEFLHHFSTSAKEIESLINKAK